MKFIAMVRILMIISGFVAGISGIAFSGQNFTIWDVAYDNYLTGIRDKGFKDGRDFRDVPYFWDPSADGNCAFMKEPGVDGWDGPPTFLSDDARSDKLPQRWVVKFEQIEPAYWPYPLCIMYWSSEPILLRVEASFKQKIVPLAFVRSGYGETIEFDAPDDGLIYFWLDPLPEPATFSGFCLLAVPAGLRLIRHAGRRR